MPVAAWTSSRSTARLVRAADRGSPITPTFQLCRSLAGSALSPREGREVPCGPGPLAAALLGDREALVGDVAHPRHRRGQQPEDAGQTADGGDPNRRAAADPPPGEAAAP